MKDTFDSIVAWFLVAMAVLAIGVLILIIVISPILVLVGGVYGVCWALHQFGVI